METFHFHLFSVPVVLLIIAHLFMMCDLATRFKVGVIVASNVATLIHLVAPPVIRFITPAVSWLVFPSALLMMVGWTLMTLWPVIEMWRDPLMGKPESTA